MAYDVVLLTALLFVVTFFFTLVFGNVAEHGSRLALQGLLWISIGGYFIWYWTHGGQTLAMQTWRIKLVDYHGREVTLRQALLRYIAATAGLLFFGAGLVWALLDREGLFLHDRLVGTRLGLTSGKP